MTDTPWEPGWVIFDTKRGDILQTGRVLAFRTKEEAEKAFASKHVSCAALSFHMVSRDMGERQKYINARYQIRKVSLSWMS